MFRTSVPIIRARVPLSCIPLGNRFRDPEIHLERSPPVCTTILNINLTNNLPFQEAHV